MDINKIFEPYAQTETTVTVPKTFFVQLFDQLQCNISHQFINSGVICEDGILYEEDCIKTWLSKNKVSPLTRERISKPIKSHTLNGIKNIIFEHFDREYFDEYVCEKYMTYSKHTVIIHKLLNEPNNAEINKLLRYNSFEIDKLLNLGYASNILNLEIKIFDHILNNMIGDCNDVYWISALQSYDYTQNDYQTKFEKLINKKCIKADLLCDFNYNLPRINKLFETITKENAISYELAITKYSGYNYKFLLEHLIKKPELLDILTYNMIVYFSTGCLDYCTSKIDYDYLSQKVIIDWLRQKIKELPKDFNVKEYWNKGSTSTNASESERIIELFTLLYNTCFIFNQVVLHSEDEKEKYKQIIEDEYTFLEYLINSNKSDLFLSCIDDFVQYARICDTNKNSNKLNCIKKYFDRALLLVEQSNLSEEEKLYIHLHIFNKGMINLIEKETDSVNELVDLGIINYYFTTRTFQELNKMLINFGRLCVVYDYEGISIIIKYLLEKINNNIKNQKDLLNLLSPINEIILECTKSIFENTVSKFNEFFNSSTLQVPILLISNIIEINNICKNNLNPEIFRMIINNSHIICGNPLGLICDHFITVAYPHILTILYKIFVGSSCEKLGNITAFLSTFLRSSQKKNNQDVSYWSEDQKQYCSTVIPAIYYKLNKDYLEKIKNQYTDLLISNKKPTCGRGFLYICKCDESFVFTLKKYAAYDNRFNS